MYLKTLQINRINTITVCSLTLRKLATKPARISLKTNSGMIISGYDGPTEIYPLFWIHCYSLSHKNNNPT